MKIKDLIEAKKKGYGQIEVRDIVKAAGGEDAIKAKYKDTSAEDVLTALYKVHTKLVNEFLDKFEEVGEVDYTQLADWVDDRFFSSDDRADD